MTRNEWKEKINSSPYFCLPSYALSAVREREKNKLINVLLDFGLTYITNKNTKEYLRSGDSTGNDNDETACFEYGVEVWETVDACMKAYNAEKGNFFNYFLKALNNGYRKWTAKSICANVSAGMSDIDYEQMSKIRDLVEAENVRQGGNVGCEQFISDVAKKARCSRETAKRYIMVIVEGVSRLDAPVIGEEGDDDSSHLDFVGDGKSEEAFSDIVGDDRYMLLEMIQDVFNGLQGRQKPIISELITACLFDIDELHEILKEYSFFNAHIFEICSSKKHSVTQKEIAFMHDRDEASVSRSWKEFQQRLSKRRCQ